MLETSILSSTLLTPPSQPISLHTTLTILRKCVLIPAEIVTPHPPLSSLTPSSQDPEFPNHPVQLDRSSHHQPWGWVETVSTAHPFWLQQFFRKCHKIQFRPMKCEEMLDESTTGRNILSLPWELLK